MWAHAEPLQSYPVIREASRWMDTAFLYYIWFPKNSEEKFGISLDSHIVRQLQKMPRIWVRQSQFYNSTAIAICLGNSNAIAIFPTLYVSLVRLNTGKHVLFV